MKDKFVLAEYKVILRRRINVPADKLWTFMKTPGHLTRCHPFCRDNITEKWENKGLGSRDEVLYHNGRSLYRDFIQWSEGEGYEVAVSDDKGEEHADVWFGIKKDTERSGQQCCIMELAAVPIIKKTRLPFFLRRVLWVLVQRPLMIYYFSGILKGYEFYLTTGKIVKKNQFGWHPQYS